MAHATASDVQTRLGRTLTTEETTLVNTRLADVERKILRRIPDLDDQAEDEDFLADLIQVEADAVLRLVRNPDGYASETDGTYGYEFSREIASGKLEITADEWATLGVIESTGFFVLVPEPVLPEAPDVHPFMTGG